MKKETEINGSKQQRQRDEIYKDRGEGGNCHEEEETKGKGEKETKIEWKEETSMKKKNKETKGEGGERD
jgi:hypothetical protein